MIEPVYGSGAPVWTPFGSPTLAGIPPLVTTAGQGMAVPGPLPFANGPAALLGAVAIDPTAGVTAPVLLAAVAMRRGQPQGPANDQEVEEFMYDALELLPGAADVEIRCDSGRVTLTGTVQHKRVKRDVGEIAWAIPALHDVDNNVTIASRRRTRSAGREPEVASSAQGKKQS